MSTTPSTYEKIRNEVARRIDALQLFSSKVKHAKIPDDGDFNLVGAILSWDTEKEGSGTNSQEDIAYPCVLTHRAGTTGAWADKMGFIGDMRQKIRREFHQKRTIIDDNNVAPLATKVQYGPIGAAKGEVELSQKWVHRWDETSIAIIVWMRELRNIT